MLLRRFSKHVSDQNWFAVGLDVLVVITGIFLGMQVNDWNDTRKERIEERGYLTRLLLDADQSVKTQIKTLEYMSANKDMIDLAYKMLSDKQVTQENLGEFSTNYSFIYRWDKLNYYTDTIDELISTGKLTLIRSEDVRAKIARFRKQLELNDASNANLGRILLEQEVILSGILKRDSEYESILMSPEKLNNSDVIHNRFNAMRAYHRLIFKFAERYHKSSLRFRDDITEAIRTLK